MADLAHQERRRRGSLIVRARGEISEGRPWRARAHLHTLLQREPGHAEGRALLVETLLAMDDRAGAERVAGVALPADGEDPGGAVALRSPGARLKAAVVLPVQFVAASVVVLGIGAVFAIPFALFGAGLYQLGTWLSFW